ncbi:hypothetical protein ACXKGW_28765, partial [Klebsiella pneumoniae subsp. pneumoniae]
TIVDGFLAFLEGWAFLIRVCLWSAAAFYQQFACSRLFAIICLSRESKALAMACLSLRLSFLFNASLCFSNELIASAELLIFFPLAPSASWCAISDVRAPNFSVTFLIKVGS